MFGALQNNAIFLLEVKKEIETGRSFQYVSVKRNPGYFNRAPLGRRNLISAGETMFQDVRCVRCS